MDSKIKRSSSLSYFTEFDIEGDAVGKSDRPEDPLPLVAMDQVPVAHHCRRRSTEDREHGTYYVSTKKPPCSP